ncbi:5-dehydro-4-deoxy-D-glucuronate isomerase [Hymenobacter lapidarius]|uniref:5-dehydro-4-deoxy-D-glucuronate isomerase n=1 Tax=Hymenobacter lapidarius TaxID=1908237 RepID=UPI0029370E9D|nr:5-dehydro-4-deoxy-D-glucuronate isomerase [Hymenobacter lapidarius]
MSGVAESELFPRAPRAGRVERGRGRHHHRRRPGVRTGKPGLPLHRPGFQRSDLCQRDAANPAKYYLLSAPAHAAHPTTRRTQAEATPVEMGAAETANRRTIYKYIYAEGIQSCQLVMGLTQLLPGNVWNTMPAHTHDRRMEAYLYFSLPAGQRVLHLLGEPSETRPLWVSNEQAILSPPWSIHTGCGTAAYAFIWGMAGENREYTDMDTVPPHDLR